MRGCLNWSKFGRGGSSSNISPSSIADCAVPGREPGVGVGLRPKAIADAGRLMPAMREPVTRPAAEGGRATEPGRRAGGWRVFWEVPKREALSSVDRSLSNPTREQS